VDVSGVGSVRGVESRTSARIGALSSRVLVAEGRQHAATFRMPPQLSIACAPDPLHLLIDDWSRSSHAGGRRPAATAVELGVPVRSRPGLPRTVVVVIDDHRRSFAVLVTSGSARRTPAAPDPPVAGPGRMPTTSIVHDVGAHAPIYRDSCSSPRRGAGGDSGDHCGAARARHRPPRRRRTASSRARRAHRGAPGTVPDQLLQGVAQGARVVGGHVQALCGRA